MRAVPAFDVAQGLQRPQMKRHLSNTRQGFATALAFRQTAVRNPVVCEGHSKLSRLRSSADSEKLALPDVKTSNAIRLAFEGLGDRTYLLTRASIMDILQV